MKKHKSGLLIDVLLILMMVLPFVGAIAMKVMYTPATEGISITGALVYFIIHMPIQDLPITESQVNSLAVMISLLGLCLYFTRGLAVRPVKKRQLAAEWAIEKVNNMVHDNMGERFMGYAPFVTAILALSAFSSLSSLLGLFAPTSDVNIVAGWAILVFVLITYYKLKGGVFNYLKGFTEPIFVFTPFNIIGEISTPVSMSFRHYGNVLSGAVVSTLVASALGGLSAQLFSWLPGALSGIPVLRVGIPAVLSLYFDLFSGCMQAFIFAMLTMLYIANGFPAEEYERRKAKRLEKKALHIA